MQHQDYVKLQTIQFLPELEIQSHELYWRLNGSADKVQITKDALCLSAHMQIDCTTLYNAFSYKKWNKYTGISSVYLRLNFQGKIKIQVLQYAMMRSRIIETVIDEQDVNSNQLYRLPIQGSPDICGIRIFAYKDSTLYSGEYMTDQVKSFRKECNIALNICTFCRNNDVDRNLKNITSYMSSSQGCHFADHIEIFITDNAGNYRMSVEELSDKIHIQYCDALGSAGGFTAGAKKIINYKRKYFDYIIFMDDDIFFAPSILERTYLFLRCLLLPYQHYTLGGAFMKLDKPEIQHESGALWNMGQITSVKSGLDMREISSVLFNDIEEKTEYMGWWYCCIPTACIKKNGYPVPVYFHRDDVEFGLRNKRQFTLNGICVWHVSPECRVNSVYQYYDMRNMAIVNALHVQKKTETIFLRTLWKNTCKEILRFRYLNAYLILRGARDFCKGKKWILEADCGEFYNKINNCGYVLKKLASVPSGFDITSFNKQYKRPPLHNRILKLILLNGLILPSRKKIVVSAYEPKVEQFWRAKEALNYNTYDKTAFLVQKSVIETLKGVVMLLFTTIYIVVKFKKAEGSWKSEFNNR